MNLSWFDDKVCKCSTFKYRKEDVTWPEEPNWNQPPCCRACNKWDPKLVFECQKCHQLFYKWFSHPKNGFYHSNKNSDPVGWYCYSCLENDPPLAQTMVKVNVQKRKVPPSDMLVPPDYKHAVKVELPPEVQANLDAFLEKLKGLQCPNPSSEPS